MAKTDNTPKKNEQKQGGNNKGNNERSNKKGGNNNENKKEVEYKPGMSYLYDPCPHRVWTPKPGERDKSAPRGVGSPWYEPVKKKEDADKEEAKERQKKEEKASKKRQKAYEEKQKKREEEDAKMKEEEGKRKEKEEKKQKEKEKKEKEKKKRERKERKEKEHKRKEEKERQKAEDEGKMKKGAGKEKEKPQASYMYEPCPHKVYTPAPGEKDMADPKGVGSPWYVPIKKKKDVEKEEDENRQERDRRRMEEAKKRRREKREEEKLQEEERREEEERFRKREETIKKKKREEMKKRKVEEERKEIEHEEMGCGVRDSKTDITPELICMMDFITDVDERERERRGEALRWKKEELEEEIEFHLAKEAHTRDFRELVNTFIEAEWIDADKKLTMLERDERRRRRIILENMDPLAKDMLDEGKRTKALYQAAVAHRGGGISNSRRGKEIGDGPNAEEDALIGQIMRQLDLLDGKITE